MIPVGFHEGQPSLILSVSRVDMDEEGALHAAMLRQLRPGHRFVQLRDAEWGDPKLDRQIAYTLSSRDCDVDFWLYRSAEEEDWPVAPVWKILDISNLLACTSSQDVLKRLSKLPLLPQPDELVAVLPDMAVVNESVLDEIATQLDPTIGWLYVDSRDETRARAVAERCATSWGVRAA